MERRRDYRVRCRITGAVQGVGYRYWTRQMAQQLGLQGWVMNQADGSVCALFIGAEETVRKMMSACQDGPAAAVVHSLAEEPQQKGDEVWAGQNFKIRY